jgi:hypothetical protein
MYVVSAHFLIPDNTPQLAGGAVVSSYTYVFATVEQLNITFPINPEDGWRVTMRYVGPFGAVGYLTATVPSGHSAELTVAGTNAVVAGPSTSDAMGNTLSQPGLATWLYIAASTTWYRV